MAQQIQHHPLDFYGFEKNWSFFDEPMYQINKNPPGVSYLLALAAWMVGWREVALHTVFLLPLFALSLGTYRLAQTLTDRPAIATLLATVSPAVLVSSSNLMADTLTLALSVWAVERWVRGLRNHSRHALWTSTLLLSLAVLTKYLALCFLPLLIAYALIERAPWRQWAWPFVIPVALIGLYQWWSYRLYGVNLIESAATFSTTFQEPEREGTPPGARAVIGLAFAGGCHVAALFFLPVLWKWRTAFYIAGIPLVLLATVLIFGGNFAETLVHPAFEPTTLLLVHLAAFTVAGAHLGVLAAHDAHRNRNAAACLLALWVLGFFLFSTFVNWTVNGRTMLPMAPAVGILIARRLDTLAAQGQPASNRRVAVAAVPCVLIALAVTAADYRLAQAGRTAAQQFHAIRHEFSGNAWIQGNWGPRWYFEAAGATPFDAREPSVRSGDVVIQSSNNLVYPLPPELTHIIHEDAVAAGRWLTTMDRSLGAGFYASVWGPLPYAFGPVPPERYHYLLLDPQ